MTRLKLCVICNSAACGFVYVKHTGRNRVVQVDLCENHMGDILKRLNLAVATGR